MEPDANITTPASSGVTTGQKELLEVMPQGEHDFIRWFIDAASAELVELAEEAPETPLAIAGGEGIDGVGATGMRRIASDCSMIGVQDEAMKEGYSDDSVDISIKGKGISLILAQSSEDRRVRASPQDAARTKVNAAHGLYERRRRQKINQRLKTLSRLVPNAYENDDQASLLDKAIEHIKHLQAYDRVLDTINHNQMVATRNLYSIINGMGTPNTMFMMPYLPTMGMEIGNAPTPTFFPPVLFPAFSQFPSHAFKCHDVPNPTHWSPSMPYQPHMPPEMDEFSSASPSQPPFSSGN